MPIKNIIFDLGGVIINIQVLKIFEKISNLSNSFPPSQLDVIYNLNATFEIGKISEDEFFNQLKQALNIGHISDDYLVDLWNEVLLDIPTTRVELLESLNKKYRLFLLSNTNSTHLKGVNKVLSQSSGYSNLNNLFEKTYYSFELQLRKPDLKIFETVLVENNLNPEETLFIDDILENTLGAESIGIKTIYLCAPLTIEEALRDYV